MTTPLPPPVTTPGARETTPLTVTDGGTGGDQGRAARYGTFRDRSDGRRGSSSKEPRSVTVSGGDGDFQSPFGETSTILILVGLWYLLNTLYNIDNKRAVKMLPLPWTVSTIQLFVGYFWFFPLWAFQLRAPPIITNWNAFWWKIAPQGVFHFWVHAGACISMAAGAVSFTQIVKAGEPVVTAFFAATLLGEVMHPLTYLSLVPVVGGVSLAALKELSFTWLSFWSAMISNLGSSLRSIFAKKVMADRGEIGENIGQSNMYAILTIISSLLALVVTLFMEGSVVKSEWNRATTSVALGGAGYTATEVTLMILRSGVWYYSYNEVAFITLGRLNAVTHAVANTLKRVVIIIASILVFRTPVTVMGGVGSAVAVGGTLLYSLAKQKYK